MAQSTPPGVQALIAGRAVDGPLSAATACLDLNDNRACDAGEPVSAPTAADGSFSITVPPDQAGVHAVVVEVPAEAVDAETGAAVGTAFTMSAPATGSSGAGGRQTVFVSPLTTLVHAHMVNTGADIATATAFVQQLAGTGLSPLADFTQNPNDPAQQATARLARLVQLTANAQRALLAGVAGTPDGSGTPITEADVDRELLSSLVSALPLLAGTLTDPGLQSATGSTLQALLKVSARALAQQIDLTPDAVRMASRVHTLSEPPVADPPVPTATLRVLRYTSSENFFYRMAESGADDNQVDASGYRRYYDWFVTGTPNTVTGTSVTTGGVVPTGSSNNVYWSGSAWVTRSANQRYLSSVRDIQGRGDYNFADNLEVGTSIRRVEDISGLPLKDVVQTRIRRFPGSTNGVAYANWGPSNLAAYGSAVFPTGSYLIYQTTTPTATAVQYNPAASNRVSVYPADIAAGGDVRTNPALACGASVASLNAVFTPAATLEDVVSRNPGQPCVFAQFGTAPNLSLSPNEWWGNGTVSLGTLASTNTLPSGTGNYYNTTADLRLAFSPTGNRVTFYRCYQRASDSSRRNCSVLGLGTWSIQALGDARVMGFSVAPALAQRLGYARYLVERGGAVYYASKSPTGVASTEPRLNLTAANAVFEQLGLPRRKPITQPGTATGARAAALTLLQGTWGAADASSAIVWRFGPDGRFFMAEAKPFDSFLREQSGAELGWFDYDPTAHYISSLLEVDSNLTSGTSHPHLGEMYQPITITSTLISGGTGANGFSFTRLETTSSSSSLVGMWGYESATDLSASHLVFFSNGRFMQIQHLADNTCANNGCPPGVEFSEYSYDVTSGIVNFFNPLYDTNGCAGVFESCAAGSNNTTAQRTITLAADGLTAVVIDLQGQPHTLYRIPAQ
jgi:hypothetical protein